MSHLVTPHLVSLHLSTLCDIRCKSGSAGTRWCQLPGRWACLPCRCCSAAASAAWPTCGATSTAASPPALLACSRGRQSRALSCAAPAAFLIQALAVASPSTSGRGTCKPRTTGRAPGAKHTC
eukprot:363483-Chlamydomonas_euryale.AAC.2